jgi:hypothetical protein
MNEKETRFNEEVALRLKDVLNVDAFYEWVHAYPDGGLVGFRGNAITRPIGMYLREGGYGKCLVGSLRASVDMGYGYIDVELPGVLRRFAAKVDKCRTYIITGKKAKRYLGEALREVG